MSRLTLGVLASAILAALVACGAPVSRESAQQASIALADALGAQESTAGYATVDGPRELNFPADHGPHPDHRTEWWYLTGNLRDADGRRYGYQFTLFRIAMAPPSAPGDLPSDGEDARSAWSTRQLYMGHLGVTDGAAGTFHSAERYSRGALGLAGVTLEPFRAWLDDWSLESETSESLFPARLRFRDGELEFDVRLAPGKPRVLHGDRGYSRKSAATETASFYYSYTRIPTSGRLRANGRSVEVTGESWMDREWSTSLLTDEHIGWDWFSLQLDREHELMLFYLRRSDGTPDPTGSGTLVYPDGTTRVLEGSEFEILPTETWSSPSGREYPIGWRIRSPALEAELEIEAILDDQEHRHAVAYWEGAVDVRGRLLGEATNGVGYVELTGY